MILPRFFFRPRNLFGASGELHYCLSLRLCYIGRAQLKNHARNGVNARRSCKARDIAYIYAGVYSLRLNRPT